MRHTPDTCAVQRKTRDVRRSYMVVLRILFNVNDILRKVDHSVGCEVAQPGHFADVGMAFSRNDAHRVISRGKRSWIAAVEI